MEKYLKQIPVRDARIFLGGTVVTEDNRGRENSHPCGMIWNPWEHEGLRTVGSKNSVALEGDPGGKITVEVFEVSLRDKKIVRKLPPTFSRNNSTEQVHVWEYGVAIVVFISGNGCSENWTVSHWRMLSGRIVFDTAKNKFQMPETEQKTPDNNGNGHGETPQVADLDPDPEDIAGKQLAHGNDKGRKPRNGRSAHAQA